MGNPGVVLVGGDIAGTWRARLAGQRTLEVTVRPFDGLPVARKELDAEAERIAAVRNLPDVRVEVAD